MSAPDASPEFPRPPHDPTPASSRPSERFRATQAAPGAVPTSQEPGVQDLQLAGSSLAEQWLAAGGHVDAGLPAGPRYRIDHLLGTGSSGRVYAVYDHNLKRTVALKALSDHGQDPGKIRDFLMEASLLARLDHPNVVPVHDIAIASSGQPFFTMKQVAGETLGEALAQLERPGGSQRVRTASQVVSIFIDVCKAVSYAHHHRVVHQDIKPDNILLGDFGEVLLLDWGSALSLEADGTIKGQSYGTPLYMSPEQTRGECATAASDTYCVGASLFQALFQRIPTWSEDATQFWDMKRSGIIQEPTAAERRRVPAQLVSIVLKALRPRPEERYPSIDAMLQDLQHYQSGLAVDAHRETMRQFTARWYRSHRHAVGITALALLFGVVIGALWYASWLKEQSSWNLVFQEDFTRPVAALGRDWRVLWRPAYPEWETFKEVPIKDQDSWHPGLGGMTVATAVGNIDLVCRRSFPGNMRVEWDYETETRNLDLNCFLGGDRKSGYTFHVGGWGNPGIVVLTQGPGYRMVDWNGIEPLRVGRTYRFSMERDENHVRLTIDGVRVIDYRSLGGMDAPDQPTFGLDTMMGSLAVRHLRVFMQRPPRLVSPLATADAFFSTKHYEDALSRYRVIEETYSGTELGVKAQFGAAISLSRSGQAQAGAEALVAFQREHPDHELVPYCLGERLHTAMEAGEVLEQEHLREELASYPGHPVQRSALVELCQAKTALLTPRQVTAVGQDAFPADIVSQLVAAIQEIVRWSSAYHLPCDSPLFIHNCQLALLQLGQTRLLLDEFPLERFPQARDTRVMALFLMGRFAEVRALSPSRYHYSLLSLELERKWKEITDACFENDQARNECRWRHERDEDLRVYRHPPPPKTMAYIQRVLASEHRDAVHDAADPRDTFHLKARALLTLDHDAQVIADYPSRSNIVAVSALKYLQAGRVQEGEALFERLRKQPWYMPYLDFDADSMFEALFARFIFPHLDDLYQGRTSDPGPALAAELPFLHDNGQQQAWYEISYILGTIDEAAFLRQPVQLQIEERLRLAHGIRAELAHDLPAARAAYDLVPPPTREPCFSGHFAAWRLAQLTQPPQQTPKP